MKIVCVKTPKFLRPLLRLFTRKKRKAKCETVVAANAPETANAAAKGDAAPSAEEKAAE